MSNGWPKSCAKKYWRKTVASYFVTSTGTDIGKTFVTAALVRYLRESNQPVAALKPVVSGNDSSIVQTSDPAVLLTALGRPVTAHEIDRIATWPFRAQLAPDPAASPESRRRPRTSQHRLRLCG